MAEASIPTLVTVADVLGADLAVRLYPNSGPRIHDRLQAPMVEALVRDVHPSWKRLVEVPVWRPVRGVIDLVLVRPGEVVVATEVHSQISRAEQQIRWGAEKAASLPSSELWSMQSGGLADMPISRLLVVRNSAANREVVRALEGTFRAVYPARTVDALAALRGQTAAWPGPALVWADVRVGSVRILDGPPRGVGLGR